MYFSTQITKKNGVTTKELFDFPTLKAAKANLFYFLSSSYANDNEYIFGEVKDEDGVVHFHDIYKEEER